MAAAGMTGHRQADARDRAWKPRDIEQKTPGQAGRSCSELFDLLKHDEISFDSLSF
jgi:hypothetical protein